MSTKVTLSDYKNLQNTVKSYETALETTTRDCENLQNKNKRLKLRINRLIQKNREGRCEEIENLNTTINRLNDKNRLQKREIGNLVITHPDYELEYLVPLVYHEKPRKTYTDYVCLKGLSSIDKAMVMSTILLSATILVSAYSLGYLSQLNPAYWVC